eukprot:Skav220659  [mRNA]  locus=scaffold2604:21832:27884:+ [translate_table: standard]
MPIKSMRWAYKAFEVTGFRHAYGAIVDSFLKQKLPHDRKESLPYPLLVLIQWERRILQSSTPIGEVIILGCFLIQAWGSLRFSDMQRSSPFNLCYDDRSLRGMSLRTKTGVQGAPFGLLASGFLSLGSWTWVEKFLRTLDQVLNHPSGSAVDFLLPRVTSDGHSIVYPLQPMPYGEALYWARTFLSLPWRSTPLIVENSILSYTIHGLKSTFLSWASQIQVSKDLRRLQGHHREDTLHSRGCDILAFDILIDPTCDLLSDVQYERLLRLCISGSVMYCAASPACREYSRLKLKPGGPPALRTPEHLEGIPGLDASSLLQVQESFLMLSRSVMCIRLTHSSGNHGHLEQPLSAMSWSEPVVQDYIIDCSCTCSVIAACQVGKDWSKAWLFAGTNPLWEQLAKPCPHPPFTHQNIAGVRTAAGTYLSRETAEYPPALANAFADTFSSLFSKHAHRVTWDHMESILPVKSLDAPPFARQDGGGISFADWSAPPAGSSDLFGSLRKSWMNLIISQRLDKQVLAHFSLQKEHAPFDSSQLEPFRICLEEFLTAHNATVDWSIAPDQPMHLSILQSLSTLMHDPDQALFPYLQAGVPTGFTAPITPSNCFPLVQSDSEPPQDLLSIHHANWASAEAEPDIVADLVQKELDEGWVEPFAGDIADAQVRWPLGVAVGKLGLALSDTRPPRLVVDSSVCGVNPRCVMPERSTLPTARDVIRSYPIRNSSQELLGFSLDVKSAHKRIAVHPDHRGLLGFQFRNQLYFYKVAPFGAVFSAHYWSRLGGFILRFIHKLVWLAHASFLYVDDFLMFQDKLIMPITAAMLCIFAQILKIPISWKKCELSQSITWIGWCFHISVGYITLPRDKRNRMLDLMESLLRHEKCAVKHIQKFLGLAMWITQLAPHMRTWLHYLYRDLHSIPASQFSVDPGNWEQVIQCIDDNLVFTTRPPGTAIPIGGKLIQVRHQSVDSKQDLQRVFLSDRRVWLRIRDPKSTKRKLSSDSHRILNLYRNWLQHCSPYFSMWPKPQWDGLCVADAFAAGDSCGIGGVVYFPDGSYKWFSLRLSSADFVALQIPMHADLQKDISSLETLAQHALLYTTFKHQPGFRIALKLPALSDNSGAEAVSNKLFTTTMPLALFVEKISLLSALSGCELEVSHIAGYHNDIADSLSRWNQEGEPPCQMRPSSRFSFSLADLWHIRQSPRLCPASVAIPWKFPS